ncbi:MAG: hypothetical protein R6U98_18630 [Pirellulaceae bacterium]
MDYVGGTHRPSARRVMEFIWDDIVLAVDVCPESCEVRTRVDVCRERIEAALAAARERESADEQRGTKAEITPPSWWNVKRFMADGSPCIQ